MPCRAARAEVIGKDICQRKKSLLALEDGVDLAE